jgi:Heavy-metal resistance
MRYSIINNLAVVLAMVSTFMLSSNALGQDMGSGSHREGYGSYDAMGQNPDDIIKYGEDMMRYGFRETGMSGGSSKYPGYNRNLSDATVKKLNAEQEAFIKATEDLRQTIYEKELYLKAELVKKAPDTATALSIQKSISEAKGQFEQKMIEHIIRMKRIDLAAETK